MTNELRFGERIFLLATSVAAGPILVLIGIEGQEIQQYLRVQHMFFGIVLMVLSLVALRGLWRIEH